jgi:hypothetical protein
MKKTAPLKRLMQVYCERTGKDLSSIRFIFEGSRIREEQTPEEVSYLSPTQYINSILKLVCGSLNVFL